MDPFSPSGYETLNDTYNPGLNSTVELSGTQTNTIRCGLKAGEPGDLTIDISLCRATGHDFLDIGTGSYNQSNYPNVLLGAPRSPNQAYEVQERSKGRVFYVSTDQDGFFRVGRFFTVDQGTGTVTFAGSIALSNLDGIGFKRGVVVAEFSTDDGMTQNGSDIVPTQNAVRGYVNRRLGWDHNGVSISNIIGGGAVARNGTTAMTGNFNAGSFRVTNVAAPSTGSDAANKTYVDSATGSFNFFEGLRDYSFEKAASETDPDHTFLEGQIPTFTGLKKLYIDNHTIADGPFIAGFIYEGSNTGRAIDVDTATDGTLGAVTIISYEPINGTFTGNGSVSNDEYDIFVDEGDADVTYNGSGTDANARFGLRKGLTYNVDIQNGGTAYTAGDTFTVLGTRFSPGVSPANDATITVDTVNGSGTITAASVTGTTGKTTVPVGDAIAGPYNEIANATPAAGSDL